MRNLLALMAFAMLGMFGPANAESSKVERQQEARSMAQATLIHLYTSAPSARKAVEGAAGYAVFSDVGVKILMAGGGTGHGIVIDNKTKHETFMKMAELQAGPGFGVTKFRVVWVFEKKADMDRFVNSGWELGAQSTASAQVGGKGTDLFTGALSITPGVWLYQITENGLAVDLTAKGTRYYKDDELN
ncbi:hypothetical protein [Variovorax sp. J31P207]|uniref:lipid-binding SYLF domain-containing protein n=1 Tax=Variovorax sp. J31P207 TaxID=3053510 RepID=UPI002575087A|nr:hypothetical protein [Variovorax sp. J31P207]MDM0069634.1 hypothetical protein [Variovorax sp. J31P207]